MGTVADFARLWENCATPKPLAISREDRMAFNWTCPHCSSRQTVVDEKQDVNHRVISLRDQAEGNLIVQDYSIGCSNPECMKITIRVKIGKGGVHANSYRFVAGGNTLFDQSVYPQGSARPQPEYIPAAIREDYREACLIRDFSPKASATLIRRCLQGMIRDFAGISKSRLIDEIKALRKAVDDGSAERSVSIESVEAIDRIRDIGNIGAHMERDIDLIIDVDPGEAQVLIELVEMLFDEWYGAREKRQARLSRIDGIAGAKDQIKAKHKEQKALPAPNPSPETSADAHIMRDALLIELREHEEPGGQ